DGASSHQVRHRDVCDLCQEGIRGRQFAGPPSGARIHHGPALRRAIQAILAGATSGRDARVQIGSSGMTLPLALTLGEPAGIGPDITFAAWRRRAELGLPPFYLLADPAFIARRMERIAPDTPLAVVEPAAAAAPLPTPLPGLHT